MDQEAELRLLLKCSVLENELRINKTNYYFNCQIEAMEKLSKLKNCKENAKDIKALKESIKGFKAKIKSADKYNSEMLDVFLKSGGNKELYYSIIDKSTDLYDDLTKLFLDALNSLTENKGKIIHSALLEESSKGTVTLEGKTYFITKKAV